VNKFSEILLIKSDKSELVNVEAFLLDIFKKYQFPDNKFSRVLLCVSEAILNSIHHGNKDIVTKTVKICVGCNLHSMNIEITDEGKGFDPSMIDDPTKAINIRKESGRGIHIIKSLCDHMEYKNSGSCIKIKISFR